MSRQAREGQPTHLLNSDKAPGSSVAGGSSSSGPGSSLAMPKWLRVLPFFLSSLLFLSGFFAILAPLPLLLLAFQGGRRWLLFGAITNAALTLVAAGPVSLAFYAVFIVVSSTALSELLKKGRRPESAAAWTLLSMVLVGAAAIAIHSQLQGIDPIAGVRQEVNRVVDYLIQSLPPETRSEWIGDAAPDEVKRSILIDLPFAISVFSLLMVWANLMAVLRLNPGGIRERVGLTPDWFKNWKAPEWLIWPTIACGFFLVVEVENVSLVALNLFRFLMTIFAIQGLSILSFLFDTWKVQGLFRSLGYFAVIFLMMPLLLSIGFFDTWFDFRSKLRQS